MIYKYEMELFITLCNDYRIWNKIFELSSYGFQSKLSNT